MTYFNIIHDLCLEMGLEFNAVKEGAFLTGFIEREHTMVPGPDGKLGYGGKCFPVNMASMRSFLTKNKKEEAAVIFAMIQRLNREFRGE